MNWALYIWAISFLCLQILFANFSSAQKKGSSYIDKHCHHITGNSNTCEWIIIAVSGRITGKVISFITDGGRCGDEINAAVAIIERKSDTVRAILPCFTGYLNPKNKVTIKLIQEPTSDDISYPQYEKRNGRKTGKVYKHTVAEFDKSVLKTVFGTGVRTK